LTACGVRRSAFCRRRRKGFSKKIVNLAQRFPHGGVAEVTLFDQSES
jgi:hypothetical protein